ncbi:MAG: DUF2855 family protein, partial [Solirubrobacterales bacterium]
MADFLIKRGDLHRTRFAEAEAPEPRDGEAVLAVERFGLTANNITYAVMGEAMNYWEFFPAEEDGWGRMPVWGFATVSSSRHPELKQGTRVYGYLPPSSHLLVVPDRVDERGFTDAAPHRASLPSAYQAYRRTDADLAYDASREDEQILFWPLFYTSFLVDDFLADEELFGAGTVILSSASSKTALIAAYLLAQRDGVELIGMTSEGNVDFVRGLKLYDEVLTYEEVDSLPAEGTVYADFSGNASLRAAVHEQCGEGLAHSAIIGITHWDEMAATGSELPGPAPSFFFAPDRIRKRGEDWGAAELEKRVAAAWHPFAEWSGGWLEVRHGEGPEALEKTYLEVLDGEIGPEVGP